jgi:hypothetical protein
MAVCFILFDKFLISGMGILGYWDINDYGIWNMGVIKSSTSNVYAFEGVGRRNLDSNLFAICMSGFLCEIEHED